MDVMFYFILVVGVYCVGLFVNDVDRNKAVDCFDYCCYSYCIVAVECWFCVLVVWFFYVLDNVLLIFNYYSYVEFGWW